MKTVGLACAAMLSLIAASAPWKTYVNVRYEYSACYPAILVAGREADNSDGKSFSNGQGLKISVWGSNNIGNISLATAKREAIPASSVTPKVTYDFQRGNVAAISGVAGRSVFYSKIIKRDDQFLTLSATYPLAGQKQADAIVAAMARCFRSTT